MAFAQALPLRPQRGDFGGQLLGRTPAQLADGQGASAAQAFGVAGQRGVEIGIAAGQTGKHILDEQIFGEPVERKGFVIGKAFIGVGKNHVEPFAEKSAHRAFTEFSQIRKRQGFLPRLPIGQGRGGVEVLRMRVRPFARIGNQAAAFKVSSAERLQRMFDRE